MEYVWRREDMLKRDRAAFLMEVIQNDKSLQAVEYPARYLNAEVKLNVKPLAVEEFVKWWRANGLTLR